MRPYLGACVSFAFLLIIGNHVNSLPTRRSSNANKLVARHAELVLPDIQEITTPNIEVDSGIAVRNMDGKLLPDSTPPAKNEGPGGSSSQDVPAHSTTALGADSSHDFKQHVPKQKRIGTVLSEDTKRQKLQHPPLSHCPKLPNSKPDYAPSSYPGTSSGAPNSEKASYAFRRTESTMDPKEALKLINEMLTMQLDEKSLPWKIDGVWTDGVMKAVLQALINKKWTSGRRTNTIQIKEAKEGGKPRLLDLSRPSAAQVQAMNRATLITKLDGLWDEAVERRSDALKAKKKKTQENGKMYLARIKSGAMQVMPDKKVTTLLRNLPEPDSLDVMSDMPWNDQDSQKWWDPSWLKPVLERIWERQGQRCYGLANDPRVQEKRRMILEGPEDSKEMKKEMDEAWKWWLEDKAHTTEIRQERTKKKLEEDQ